MCQNTNRTKLIYEKDQSLTASTLGTFKAWCRIGNIWEQFLTTTSPLLLLAFSLLREGGRGESWGESNLLTWGGPLLGSRCGVQQESICNPHSMPRHRKSLWKPLYLILLTVPLTQDNTFSFPNRRGRDRDRRIFPPSFKMPVFVITGANRGLGLEFVRQLSADSSNTILAATRSLSRDLGL